MVVPINVVNNAIVDGPGAVELRVIPTDDISGAPLMSAMVEKLRMPEHCQYQGVDGDGDGFVDRVDEVILREIFPGGPVVPSLVYWHVGRGQFQYNDHGAGVQFHLDLDAAYELNPDNSLPDRVVFRTSVIIPPFPPKVVVRGITWVGTYRSKDGSGQVFVSVNAEEDAFGSLVDTLSISVMSGPYRFYSNFGVLKGGNIKWFPAD